MGGVIVALVSASGCSKPAKLVPASGLLVIGGKPGSAVVVQFLPQSVDGEKRPTSFATTDDEGRFTLRTYDDKEGAVVGQHTVLLVDTQEERPPQGERFTKPARVHPKYATMAGGLTATVVEGGPPIEITVPGAGRASPP
jgi:hypothetical protein